MQNRLMYIKGGRITMAILEKKPSPKDPRQPNKGFPASKDRRINRLIYSVIAQIGVFLQKEGMKVGR